MSNRSLVNDMERARLQAVDEDLGRALLRFQQARLETRNRLTLEDIFRGRNPYLLRERYHAAHEIVSSSLERYLYALDEAQLDAHPLPCLEPAELVAQFARAKLPLQNEVLDARDRAENRLLMEFYTRLCTDDAVIDWQLLTRFILECKARDWKMKAVNGN